MKLIEETHQKGALDLDLEAVKDVNVACCDVGLQTALDGRIWLCVNGRAFVRFKPTRGEPASEVEKKRTLAEWRELVVARLKAAGIPAQVAVRSAKRVEAEAANNLNAMVGVKSAHILFDPLVASLKKAALLDGLTPGQRKLQKKHGTPAEFAEAVYKCVPGDISMGEARAALEKYQKEWDEA